MCNRHFFVDGPSLLLDDNLDYANRMEPRAVQLRFQIAGHWLYNEEI